MESFPSCLYRYSTIFGRYISPLLQGMLVSSFHEFFNHHLSFDNNKYRSLFKNKNKNKDQDLKCNNSTYMSQQRQYLALQDGPY